MAKFGKTEAYKCSDGKVLIPNKKESGADFKLRVKEHELVAQIIIKLGKYFLAEHGDQSSLPNRKTTLKEIARYRNDLIGVLDEKNYNIKI